MQELTRYVRLMLVVVLTTALMFLALTSAGPSGRLKSLIFKWRPHSGQTGEIQVNLKLKSKVK